MSEIKMDMITAALDYVPEQLADMAEGQLATLLAELTALRARVAQGEAETRLDVLCPTCYGRGYVPTPHAMDTRTSYPCPTCQGDKTVSVRASEVIGRVTTTYSITPESSHA